MVLTSKLTVFIQRTRSFKALLARVVSLVKTGATEQTGVMGNKAQQVAKAQRVHAVILARKVHAVHKVFKAQRVQKANRVHAVLTVLCRSSFKARTQAQWKARL
jgi:hypothetical protein